MGEDQTEKYCHYYLIFSEWEVSPEYELDAGGEDEGDGAAAGEHKDEGEEGEQPHQEQVAGHSRGLTQC